LPSFVRESIFSLKGGAMPTPEPSAQHEELELEEGRVARWRFGQFRSLGFEDVEAWLLAASAADLHLTRSLVAAGCPLHLALKIAV
jgi:hypothetical protein